MSLIFHDIKYFGEYHHAGSEKRVFRHFFFSSQHLKNNLWYIFEVETVQFGRFLQRGFIQKTSGSWPPELRQKLPVFWSFLLFSLSHHLVVDAEDTGPKIRSEN